MSEINIGLLKAEIVAEVMAQLSAEGTKEPGIGCHAEKFEGLVDSGPGFPHRASDTWGWKWIESTGSFMVWNAAVFSKGVWKVGAGATSFPLSAGGTLYIYAKLNLSSGVLSVESGATEADAQTKATDVSSGIVKVLAFRVERSGGGAFKMGRDYIHGGMAAEKVIEGDATKVAMKWDNTAKEWAAVLPADALTDDPDEAEVLKKDDRVVVGLQTGASGLLQAVTAPLEGTPDGNYDNVAMKWNFSDEIWNAVPAVDADTDNNNFTVLGAGDLVLVGLQKGTSGLVCGLTRPLPDMAGGDLEGFSERTGAIVDIKWDSDYTKIQVKTATILVKDDTEDVYWIDFLTFTPFDD